MGPVPHPLLVVHHRLTRPPSSQLATAATTNALGLARVSLVALEHPGSFQVWLYVDKPGRSAVVSAPVTVRRR